jgi:mRNA interferase RelE/StbE
MYKIAFAPEAKNEFLNLEKTHQKQIAKKILSLENGHFTNDKALKGKHKGKFRKRAGNYRIIYLKENNLVLITIIRIAHRKEVY